MVARLFGDRYLFTGEQRTRSAREFRLLAELSRRGLPVPAPIASRYVRHVRQELFARHGVPLGGQLEFVDRGTLAHAFGSRQSLG